MKHFLTLFIFVLIFLSKRTLKKKYLADERTTLFISMRKNEVRALQREREIRISDILQRHPVDLTALRSISREKGNINIPLIETNEFSDLLIVITDLFSRRIFNFKN